MNKHDVNNDNNVNDQDLKQWEKANDPKHLLTLNKKQDKALHQGSADLYSRIHYLHYFQFNAKITPQLFILLANRPLALKILAIIMYCAWPSRWGAVIIKQKDLGKAVANTPGKSANRTSVARAIHYLRALGILAVSKYDVRDAYIINPKFIWQKPPTETYLKRSILKNPKHIHFDTRPGYVRQVPSIKATLEKLHRPIAFPLYSTDFKYLHTRSNARTFTEIRRDQNGKPIKNSKGHIEKIRVKRPFISYYDKIFQHGYRKEAKLKRKARHEYYIEHRK